MKTRRSNFIKLLTYMNENNLNVIDIKRALNCPICFQRYLYTGLPDHISNKLNIIFNINLEVSKLEPFHQEVGSKSGRRRSKVLPISQNTLLQQFTSELGEVLHTYRFKNNFTLNQMSQKLDIPLNTYYNLERGSAAYISLSVLRKLKEIKSKYETF